MNYPFLFSSSERRGLYLLLILAALIVAAKFIFFPPETISFEKQVSIEKANRDSTHQNYSTERKWKNYESKPYSKKQNSNSYHEKQTCTPFSPKPKIKVEPVELNSATKEQLVTLNGIGESYASRIIKYREILGGYMFKEQLLRVYGLDSVLFNKIKDDVFVNTDLVKKYDVNQASEEELAQYKRIGYKRAKVLVAYRKQHGKFTSLKDLSKTRVFSDSLLFLIEPYILIK